MSPQTLRCSLCAEKLPPAADTCPHCLESCRSPGSRPRRPWSAADAVCLTIAGLAVCATLAVVCLFLMALESVEAGAKGYGRCPGMLRQIGLAIGIYRSRNDDAWPDSIEAALEASDMTDAACPASGRPYLLRDLDARPLRVDGQGRPEHDDAAIAVCPEPHEYWFHSTRHFVLYVVDSGSDAPFVEPGPEFEALLDEMGRAEGPVDTRPR